MLLELLGAVGVTLILVRGAVFAWLRRAPGLRAVVKCAMCTGWWVGAGESVATLRHVAGDLRDQVLAVVIFAGGVSVVATLADFTLAYLDSHTEAS